MTGLFADPPEDLEEARGGFIVGGMADYRDAADLARAYKLAADLLIEHAGDSGDTWQVGYPALFLYRHMLELYFKAVVPASPQTHSLNRLLGLFVAQVNSQLHEHVQPRFRDDIRRFASLDPDSQAFRYADDGQEGRPLASTEVAVELEQLLAVTDRVARAFENVLNASRR